jgi:hypothetical protein
MVFLLLFVSGAFRRRNARGRGKPLLFPIEIGAKKRAEISRPTAFFAEAATRLLAGQALVQKRRFREDDFRQNVYMNTRTLMAEKGNLTSANYDPSGEERIIQVVALMARQRRRRGLATTPRPAAESTT